MHPIFQRTPSIAPNAGNIYDGDTLNRKPDCEHLRDGILAAKTPFVLAVNASWGAGKTTFLQMLREECKVAGMRSVYFDAWKNDFHSDALAPMIGEISKQLAPKGKFKESIQVVGRTIMSMETYTRGIDLVMNILGKAEPTTATAELAGAEMPKADNLRKFLQKMNTKSNAIVEYTEREKAMDNFRAELEKFATVKESKPLVFFVDELDRCRPIFAVEVLEKIKHVFDVRGVFFVIAVNKNELGKILRAVYGDIDAAAYLRRFFDFEFMLENRGDVVTAALARCKADVSNIRDDRDLYEYLPLMCRDFGLSARDQEQIAALVVSALSLVKAASDFDSIVFAFFVVLKFDNPDLYAECLAMARGNFVSSPFEKVINYYELKTGAYSNMESGNRNHPHYAPIFHLSALHYVSDKDYRQIVDKRVHDARIERSQTRGSWGQPLLWEEISSRHPSSDHYLRAHLRAIFENIEFSAEKQR